jgi:hypothetical protein
MRRARLSVLLATALALGGCTSSLSPPFAPQATMSEQGRCTIVTMRSDRDWSHWDAQLCDAPGQTPGAERSQAWLASLVERALDDAEIAACGVPRCAAHERAVRLYVVPSPEPALRSQTDDDRIAIVVSTALVDRVGNDGGFYELVFARELAYLRLGATCGEGVQAGGPLRDLACDHEALRWLTGRQPDDEAWARRERILAEARAR